MVEDKCSLKGNFAVLVLAADDHFGGENGQISCFGQGAAICRGVTSEI